jgi:hypothetical protein
MDNVQNCNSYKHFSVFYKSVQEYFGLVPPLDHDRLLPNPFQLIVIHLYKPVDQCYWITYCELPNRSFKGEKNTEEY